jgi:ATP phosphoribosyltransferase
MLRIALPNKGRLVDDTRRLFLDAGLDLAGAGDRALTTTLGDDFRVLFVRAHDIPEFIADGAADAGVTGWDLVCESEREVACVQDLGFGACRLVVAAREDSSVTSLEEVPSGARVATVFPQLARRFFADRCISVEVVPMSGAVEVAPHLGIADLVVDLSSTGSTLRVNGLREIGLVLHSTARLIASSSVVADSGERGRSLRELDAALTSVLRARGQRYLMANVPRDQLEHVKEVLPGLNGPTVIDILNGGTHVAVHAVVKAAVVFRTIASLKALGAEGILITRIERLMP